MDPVPRGAGAGRDTGASSMGPTPPDAAPGGGEGPLAPTGPRGTPGRRRRLRRTRHAGAEPSGRPGGPSAAQLRGVHRPRARTSSPGRTSRPPGRPPGPTTRTPRSEPWPPATPRPCRPWWSVSPRTRIPPYGPRRPVTRTSRSPGWHNSSTTRNSPTRPPRTRRWTRTWYGDWCGRSETGSPPTSPRPVCSAPGFHGTARSGPGEDPGEPFESKRADGAGGRRMLLSLTLWTCQGQFTVADTAAALLGWEPCVCS